MPPPTPGILCHHRQALPFSLTSQPPSLPLPAFPWFLILQLQKNKFLGLVNRPTERPGRRPPLHSITHPNASSDTFNLFFNSFTIRNDD